MSRVKGVFKPSDYPNPDEATRAGLKEAFEYIMPGMENPEFPIAKGPWAHVMAHSPGLALSLAKVGTQLGGMTWFQNGALRELGLQTVANWFEAEFSFQSHLPVAGRVGLPLEKIAAIPYWRTTTYFNDEERLVVEYCQAVCAGEVPDELFARVVAQYDEKQAIELTTAICFWAFWAMFTNATKPDLPPIG
jgi:alkylhydroperoxidase family enzyme